MPAVHGMPPLAVQSPGGVDLAVRNCKSHRSAGEAGGSLVHAIAPARERAATVTMSMHLAPFRQCISDLFTECDPTR